MAAPLPAEASRCKPMESNTSYFAPKLQATAVRGQICCTSLLMLACGMAFIIALGRIFTGISFNGYPLAGFLAYGAFAACCVCGLWRIALRCTTKCFLFCCAGLYMAIQGLLIATYSSSWAWVMDAAVFNHFLSSLARNGYAIETLNQLSNYYDYNAWTYRAFPFYYLLKCTTGDGFFRAVQIFQSLVGTGTLLLVWRIAFLLFGKRVAAIAGIIYCLMPGHWVQALPLNHQVLGSAYYLAAMWLLAEWLYGNWTGRKKAFIPLTLCLLAMGMIFARGLLPVYILTGGAVWVCHFIFQPRGGRTFATEGVCLFLFPYVFATLAIIPFQTRIAAGDTAKMNGGSPAFMARGWQPETKGEYAATYEKIDILTPGTEKALIANAIIATQLSYNTTDIFLRLLPAKLAKYMLLGYADPYEELLHLNHAPRPATLFRGARIAFSLLILPLIVLGYFWLLATPRDPRALFLVLPAAFFMLGTTIFGETSPRYSAHVQPFLFIAAAVVLASPKQVGGEGMGTMIRNAAFGMTTILVLYGSLFVLAYKGNSVLRPHAVLDMREWNTTQETIRPPLPDTLAPLEMKLNPSIHDGRTTWGTLLPPKTATRKNQKIIGYLLLHAPRTTQSRILIQVDSQYGTRPYSTQNTGSHQIRFPDGTLPDAIHFSAVGEHPYPLSVGYFLPIP